MKALLLAFVILLSACVTWKQTGLTGVTEETPDKVRVTLADGSRVEVPSPLIRGDTLFSRGSSRRMAIPVDDVRRVEMRGISATRTTVLALGIGVTMLLVAANARDEPAPRTTTGTPVSCPLVYSWDGEAWRLDSGTFGGAITRALARTDVDNLDYVAAGPDGIVRLKVANELAETDHLDALRLIAVDHEPGTRVGPAPDGSIVTVGSLRQPVEARDFRGRNVLPRVAAADGWSWESSLSADTPARDGIVLAFHRPAGATEARLVLDAHNTPWAAHLLTEYLRAHGDELDAWYARMDADPTQARAFFGRIAHDAFLRVSVETPAGWRDAGLAWEAGPEIVKRQVIPLDLRGVEGETVRVRLEAPASFWLIDHVAIDVDVPAAPASVQELLPERARTRDGGDVRAAISGADGRMWTIVTGDWAEVTFRAPAAVPGRTRTYLVASTGWYRVDARREGPADRELLTRFEREPGAIANLSLERRARALAALAEGR